VCVCVCVCVCVSIYIGAIHFCNISQTLSKPMKEFIPSLCLYLQFKDEMFELYETESLLHNLPVIKYVSLPFTHRNYVGMCVF